MKSFAKFTLALSVFCFTMFFSTAFCDEVNIPDFNLEAAIREAIGKPEGEITVSDLEGITEFKAEDNNIRNITGIEHCVNLDRLILGINEIEDLEPLKGLIKVTELAILDNKVSDISALSSLKSLEELWLQGNKISDISPLAGLNNLKKMDLADNQIDDISALSELDNLTLLCLNFNKISDISPLSRLDNLNLLAIGNNPLSDISPLAGLDNLIELYLQNDKIVDISPLSSLSKLRKLWLLGNQISDIASLSNLTNLNSLAIGYHPLSDISPLAGLDNLIELQLRYVRIVDISSLSSLSKLQKLWLLGNQISDTASLSNLTSLTELLLLENQISDISSLSNLTRLTKLNLSNNQIKDIEPLSNLTSLTELNLSFNQIEDIQPLVDNKGLAEGDKVYLRANPLNSTAINTHIPELLERGVDIGGVRYHPYPEPSELSELEFSEDWLKVQPLLDDDIDATFSNIDDLRWLEPIAQENKVIFLGEWPHYGRTIQHLVNRILFALNTFDRYPLLIMEYQYSRSAYWDYYIGLKDDQEARDFLKNAMYDMVDEEIYERLEHLRRWNKIHPDKRIHIGCHDVEHSHHIPLRHIIIPYFQLLDPSFNIDLEKINNHLLLEKLEEQLKEAKAKNLIGDYPFLTPEYIETVIQNIRSKLFGDRTDAQVRNLTDLRFLGKHLREGKVVMHVGSPHSYSREGPYLTHDFEPTKGRTVSILLRYFSYSLDSLTDIDTDGRTGWHFMVRGLQMAYQQGLISPEKYYLYDNINEFQKLIFNKAYTHEHKPLLVKKIEWKQLANKANQVSPQLYKVVKSWEDEFKRYDAHILVPRTLICRHKELALFITTEVNETLKAK